MYPINVVFADDQPLLCESIAALLDPEDSIRICAIASDGPGLLQLVERHRPDVVLTDFQMPGLTGAEATHLLRERYPGIPVLGISLYDEDHRVRELVEAGACGFIAKGTATRHELVQAIQAAYRGEVYFSPSVLPRLPRILAADPREAYPTTRGEPLTGKELEIMRLICRELCSKQIAPLVGLTTRSVEIYREKIREKTGALNSVGIALYAVKHGIYKV